MQPKVSVVMPMLNSEEYLRECLDSAVNQTLKNIEIICVDAGSTDGTLAILEEYAARDERISIIHSTMKSYGHQMNLGLKAAKGEYLAILESDDYIKLDMYENLVDIADANELEVIKADYQIFVGDKDNREFTYVSVIYDNEYYNKVLNPSENFDLFRGKNTSWNGLYRVDFLTGNDIWHNETPGASYQDNGFWFQVFCQVKRLMFYNQPFYMLRRDNPNSSIKSKGKVYCMCDEYDFIRSVIKKDRALEKKFAPLVALYRYNNYTWNLNRIGEEFKQEFLVRFAEDYKKIQADGELKEELFTKYSWNKIQEIMNDPVAYYYRNYDEFNKKNSSEVNRLRNDLKALRNSRSYRIGRAITFIPRKIRGGIRCYQEHGLRYTLKRVLFHLGLERRAEEPKRLKKTKKDYDYYMGLKPEQYEEELKLWFKERTGKELDLENPKTFNEKIQWMKLYDSTPLKTRLADKYLVRDWVKEKIGEEYLIPLLGVYDSFDEINFDELPEQFALKANHGSGWNIIVKDKNDLDLEDAKSKLNLWLKLDYSFKAGFELHYTNIVPKIIIEEFRPCKFEYQFWCFNGTPCFISAIMSPHGDNLKASFDLEWNRLDFVTSKPVFEGNVECPAFLNEMIEIANKLCEGFSFVRVDFLYDDDRRTLYIGEMTFTPATGTVLWQPNKYDEIMGKKLVLPEKSPLPKKLM